MVCSGVRGGFALGWRGRFEHASGRVFAALELAPRKIGHPCLCLMDLCTDITCV